MKKFITIVFSLSCVALTACGGESADSTTDSNISSSTTSNTSNSNNAATSNASAISFTESYMAYEFEQFKLISLNVNLDDVYTKLPGNIIVLRIFDSSGNTYLTKAIRNNSQLSQEVSVGLHVDTLFVELYDNEQSTPLVQEITL